MGRQTQKEKVWTIHIEERKEKNDVQVNGQTNRQTVMKMIESAIVACPAEIIFIFESCVT